jgi:molecular chaperone GrpE (heat shock protein)
MQLQPIRYEYKPDNALGIKSSGEHIGFGAQAVQKIIPEAVTKNDKGYLLVNNDPIMWTMLNAIQEQQKEVEVQQRTDQQQQDQIAALRTQNSALNARLQMIERALRNKRNSTHRRRR